MRVRCCGLPRAFATGRSITTAASGFGGLDIDSGKTLVMNGALATGATSAISKTGNGTLFLNALNTYVTFNINQGTVATAGNINTAAANTTNLNGGTLLLTSASTTATTPGSLPNSTIGIGGGGRLSLAPFTGGQTTLSALAITRNATTQGTLVIDIASGFSLGSNGASGVRVIPTNVLGVTRVTAVINGVFSPAILGQFSSGTPFLLANSANDGLTPFASGSYVTAIGSVTATSVAGFTSEQNVSSSLRTYVVRTNSNLTSSANAVLRITSVGVTAAAGQGGLVTYGTPTISASVVFDPTSALAGVRRPQAKACCMSVARPLSRVI